MRELDGLKVAFCEHESYFSGFTTPSMYSTSKATGADIVFLLGPGVKPEEVSDEELLRALGAMRGKV